MRGDTFPSTIIFFNMQSENSRPLLNRTLSEIVNVSRAEHSENASLQTDTPEGSFNEVRELQPWNAFENMWWMLSGITTDVIGQPENPPDGIESTTFPWYKAGISMDLTSPVESSLYETEKESFHFAWSTTSLETTMLSPRRSPSRSSLHPANSYPALERPSPEGRAVPPLHDCKGIRKRTISSIGIERHFVFDWLDFLVTGCRQYQNGCKKTEKNLFHS